MYVSTGIKLYDKYDKMCMGQSRWFLSLMKCLICISVMLNALDKQPLAQIEEVHPQILIKTNYNFKKLTTLIF